MILTLLSPAGILAAEEPVIRAGSEIGYPPYCIVDENGEADGFSVELLSASLDAMGFRTEYVIDQWSVVKQQLEVGAIDALPLVGRTPDREDVYDFTFPYLTMHGALLVHEDETAITSLEDLTGRRTAVMAGDNAQEFLRASTYETQIITTDTFADALVALSAREVDAVVIQQFLALQLMQDLSISDLRFVGKPIMDFSQSFCFAVQEGDASLLNILNEGLAISIADGTYDRLYAKWFGPLQVLKNSYARVLVGGDHDYPPYEYLDGNGEPAGFNVELTQAIAREIGIDVEVILAPWSETFGKLLNEQIDLVQGVYYSFDRDEYLDFSTPYTVVNHSIVTRRGEFEELGSLEDLAGLQLLVMERDIMQDRVIEMGIDAELILVASQKEALRLLSEGVGDCALVAEIPALYWIEENGWEDLRVGQQVMTPEYNYAGLADAETDLLLARFSAGLTTLRSDGTYRELTTKWFGTYEQQSVTLLEVLKAFAYIFVPFVVILLLSLLWSVMLRNRVQQRTRELEQRTSELHTEIDKKEEAERQALENEARFKEYIANSPVGIIVSDELGTIMEANGAVAVMTGYMRDELPGRSLFELFDPAFDDTHYQQFVQLKQGERLGSQEQPRRKGHRSSHLKVDVYKLSAHEVLGFITDITEIKQVQDELLFDRERLSVTLRSIGDGVITTDVTGRVVLINAIAERLTGWTQAEATGRPLTEVFHIINEQTGLECRDPVSRVLETGAIVELENHTMLISRQGKRYSIADSGAPIRNRDDQIIGIVLVFRDMTEAYLVQERIQQTAKLDSLGVLAGGIAHDFNNLLSGIFGYVQLAQERISAGEDGMEYLDEVISVFHRAKDLTQQLLTFSQGGTPALKPVDLGELLTSSVSFALSGSSHGCSYQLQDDLWLCDADENQMGQVFDNLVINAQQAMPRGGTITVTAENVHLGSDHPALQKTGDYVHIMIADTGEGIPHDIQRRIFDPFFTTKQQGNGLGLATCYSIITKHNGMLTVESAPGEGAVFHIHLPRSVMIEKTAAKGSAALQRGTGKVLILDDEKILRDIIGKMLSALGYTAVEAADGKDVLELCIDLHSRQESGEIEDHGFTAAIFDLTIPGGMGERRR